MSDFLRELGYDPIRYWMFFGAAVALWLISAGLPFRRDGNLFHRLNRPWFFGLTLLIAMFAGRWPALFFYRPVNPDEAQFLSGAITTLARGDLWWTDPMTSGPLVVLPLALPALVGLPVEFTTGRLVGLALSWGVVFLSYLSVRHIHGDRLARLLVLPLACFVVCLLFWDFVPYCSEWSPLFLCALAIWLSLTAFNAEGVLASRWRLAGCGLMLGLIPFSKFQALPFAAVIGCSTLFWLQRQPGKTPKESLRASALLVGCAALIVGVMLLNLWLSGNWADEYQSYLVHNLNYTKARAMPWDSSAYVLSYLTGLSWGFTSFHCALLLLLALSQLGLRQGAWRPVVLGWLLLAAAYGTVVIPGRLYPHYLLFLALPLTLLVALQFGYTIRFGRLPSKIAAGLWIAFFLIGVGSQLGDRAWDRHSLHRLLPAANPRDPVVAFINRTKQPGDTLAVWGWRPELYVETQLPQAIREALTEAQLNDNPQREYFRGRILADLRANRPAFFVDSVGPADFILKDRATQGHEILPALAEYIRQEYREVDGHGEFRVYLRRDRPPTSAIR
jgi:hypothetical protein